MIASLKRPTLEPSSPYLKVSFGQATFDAEGQEALNTYFSRQIHHPSGASGVTIGRGYDMRHRSRAQIESELARAGVSDADAAWLAQAAGKHGQAARAFTELYRHAAPVLTLEQQHTLFETVTVPETIADIKRIFAKPDLVRQYGSTSWEQLPPKIQELVFDLRYRGDYTPSVRKRLQPLLVSGDYEGVRTLVQDRGFWQSHNVPRERIKARIAMVHE